MVPRPGERLGDYLLERKLGAGGMGAVYVGVSAGGARRAIKVPFFEEHEADRRERFRREALALSKVPPHRGVVRIHSAGEERGLVFAVLELVEGRPLDALIEAGLPAERAVGLAVEIARALEHIHAAGVVHRDLKPANVLVREDGSPVIVDFGLARDSAHSALTKTGEVVGTPAYMAPEQIDDARLAGPPADVYALGATLYEMLVGRPPFEGTGAQLLKSVLMDAPARPCARAAGPPGDLDAGHLDAVVLRALAKTPEARYPSAAALREDLERVRAGEPIKGSAPSALERLRWRLRRAPWLRRTVLAGASLALGAATLGAFLALSHARRVAADAALRDALAGARGAANGPRDELRRRLASVEERAAGPVSDAEAARRELAEMRAALKLEEDLEAAVAHVREGRATAADFTAALPPVALNAFTAAVAQVERWASARAEATVLCRLASEQLERGDAEAALGVLDAAAQLGRRCDVGPALALEERTLRARAWARRGVGPFRKNAEALVAFLSSDEGVASLGTFVRALAPGLEGPAADVLVAVDERRPSALPGELARTLAPFFRERARRALDEHVAAPDRGHRLRAAVRLTSLAWRANPHEEPPEALAQALQTVALQESARGNFAEALEAHLDAIRARAGPAMGGIDSRFQGLRKELERRLHVDPGDWPAKLCLGQLLVESGAEGDHEVGLALARQVIADDHVPLEVRVRARERAAEHLLGLKERAKALAELEVALEEDDPAPDRVCLMIANIHVEEWLDRSSAEERALTQRWAAAGLEHAIARHERTLDGTLRAARAPDRPPLEPVRPGETVAGRLRLLVVFCAIGDGEVEKAAAVAAAAADYEDWRGPLGRASVHFAKGEAATANAILTPRLDEEARRGMPDALSRLVLVLRYASKEREARDALAAEKRLRGS